MTETEHNAHWQHHHKQLCEQINQAGRREPSGDRQGAIASYTLARSYLNACLKILRRRLKENP